MKKGNVTNNAVQVSHYKWLANSCLFDMILLLEKPRLSSWTYWSDCSKSCGGGIQYRKRKCIPSSCPYPDPKNNKCYGLEYEERKCNEKCCPGWTIVTNTIECNS